MFIAQSYFMLECEIIANENSNKKSITFSQSSFLFAIVTMHIVTRYFQRNEIFRNHVILLILLSAKIKTKNLLGAFVIWVQLLA